MMEKRKLLLVAVSVGVFLVIVISASILIFTPKPSSGALAVVPAANTVTISPSKPVPAGIGGSSQLEASGRPQPASTDVVDMIRSTNGIPGLQLPPSTAVNQGTNFYLNGEQTQSGVEPGTRLEGSTGSARVRSEGNSQINVPMPRTAAVPNTTRQESRPAAASAPARAVPATVKPATAAAKPAATAIAPKSVATSEPAAPKPAAVKPATAKPPAAKPAAVPARTNNDYWIQIGAFSAKVRAEGVKETLAEKGITTIIDDGNVNGKTLYRVRVGPYTSEIEAGYWLALVKELDGFADSQIRSSTRK
jgi:DedD protein